MRFSALVENEDTSYLLNEKQLDDETGNTRNLTEFDLDIMIGISTSICVIGTVSNVMSLSYFLVNWSNKLGEKLLVLLNILDLLVCFTGTFYIAFWKFLEAHFIVETLFLMTYLMFLECTGFVTTLLTVVRTLASYFPFYEPKNKCITISFVTFFLYTAIKGYRLVYYPNVIIREGPEREKMIKLYDSMLLASLLLSISVVFTANLLTVWKLLSSGNEVAACAVEPSSTQVNRHATITILILSTLFCFFNLLYSVVVCNVILGNETISPLFRNIVASAAVPMNSAVNPFVYFCRKKEMRRFLSTIICCCSRALPRDTDIAMSFSNCVAASTNYNTNCLSCPTIQLDVVQSTRSDLESKDKH